MIKRILREPLAHFLLLGALIFVVHAWRGKEELEASSKDCIEVTAGTHRTRLHFAHLVCPKQKSVRPDSIATSNTARITDP